MSLNKTILQKVCDKTKDDKKMQDFIVNVLQEENKGIGRYTKFYKDEIEKAVLGDINED